MEQIHYSFHFFICVLQDYSYDKMGHAWQVRKIITDCSPLSFLITFNFVFMPISQHSLLLATLTVDGSGWCMLRYHGEQTNMRLNQEQDKIAIRTGGKQEML